jgi:dTDP-4-amino-4,6-dideoxygalactose transaminase
MSSLAVPQTDPRAGYLAHRSEIDEAMRRVLEGGWYILGAEVRAFEAEFAAYVGVPHTLGVANGTDAIELALRAAGVGAGDAVLTVSHTAVATVAAVELAGATPVLVDVEPSSCTMDLDRLEETLARGGHRFRAVVAVHLYGRPLDVMRLRAVCDRAGLVLVEDCAQAHGAVVEGRRVGSFGDVAAFSFYPTKNLGALGDGGAVVTKDAALAERVRLLREYGWRERYKSDVPGKNSRLDELQAALLRVKLRHLDDDNQARRRVARAYDAALDGQVAPPAAHPGHVYHQYVVQAPDRAGLAAHLKARGIGTLVHYPFPVHEQPAYAGRIAVGAGGLAVTERLAREVLSLPMFPQLEAAQVEAVVAALRAWPRG